MADAYRLIEPPYQIWAQYDLRQRNYKVKCILLRFKLRLIDSDSLTHWTHKTGNLSQTPLLLEPSEYWPLKERHYVIAAFGRFCP